MFPDLNTILISCVALIAGLAGGYLFLKPQELTLNEAEKKAEDELTKAAAEAENIHQQAIERIQNLKVRSREEEEKSKEQLKRLENLLASKQEQMQKKEQKTQEILAAVQEENKVIESFKQKNAGGKKMYVQKLSERTGQSIEQAKEEILQELMRDLELMREDRLRRYEEYLAEEKVRIAKNMIVGAIQRYAAPTSVEKKSTSITLSRDETKGKLIGKDGQFLMLIEELTGVDIVFNDSPNTINISCFDLVKKHIARETLQKLTRERMVTPEKVRQKVDEARAETERVLIKIGRDTIKQLELQGRNLPDEFAKIVGRLQFRTSYGQNILKHSFEVGNFTLMLGNELGLNMETCKVGGFFHDLGKAIDQEVGGSHDVLTKEIMDKFSFPEDETHAAWAHHDAIPQRTAEAMLVKAGDAISAGRPGARQESIEKYIERIKAIEGIANSYEGVNKVFAISAGREIRVLVEPSQLQDDDLPHLAKNIAGEIQQNVAYPGKIKVNIIRRTVNTDHAKPTAPASTANSLGKK